MPRNRRISVGIFLRGIASGLIALSFCVQLGAQNSAGRIQGTVRDTSGAALAHATVTVVEGQKGTTRALTTDESGMYVVPDLSPGAYVLRAQASGFKTLERSNIQVEVASDIRVDFDLSPGQATETVIVTDEVPIVETSNDTLGGTLSNREINDLPLNGRNYENLLPMRPGIVRYAGGGFDTTSTNGVRPEDNTYIVDGLLNTSSFSGQSVLNGAGIAGDAATIIPIDAIQEFNVQENPPAEYGWKPGAIVNVGLKSGTNDIHGTAYAFGREASFDARNYFNTADTPKTPVALEQWGGTAGGAIRKDRLFYFAGFERQTYTLGNSYSTTVPVTGSLPAPSTANCPAGVTGDCANSIADAINGIESQGLTVNPLSQNIVNLYPVNNTSSTTVQNGFPNNIQSSNAVGKVDYQIETKNSLNGMYFFGNNNGSVEDLPYLRPQWETLLHTRAQVAQGNWLWTPTAQVVNELRFGYTRLYQPTTSVDHSVNPMTYGINTGVTNPILFGMPFISVTGFNFIGPFFFSPKVQGPDETIQFVDQVSYVRRTHAFRFGAEIRRGAATAAQYRVGRGYIQFTGGNAFSGPTPSTALEDLLAGYPNLGRIQYGATPNQLSMWSIAGFAQDDWRVTPRLTLNLGLRYELNTVLKDANDRLGNFDPNVGLVQVGKQISSPYNGDHNNFAPRFGFAWDPKGDGRTVIRGGGGVFYEKFDMDLFVAAMVANAQTTGLGTIPTGGLGVQPGNGTIASGTIAFTGSSLNWSSAGPVFPTGTINCSPVSGSPCSILGVNRNIRTPYVSTWNLNVQHAFSKDLSLQVGYVANHGTKLLGNVDVNQPDATLGEQAGRPYNSKFPFLAVINMLGNHYESNYNSLQVTVTQRSSHGLSFILGYTYGHTLDQQSENYATVGPQNNHNLSAEYGNSDFDIRHRLTFSTGYAIPARHVKGQVLEGWQLNSILTVQSAQPWGVVDATDDISQTGELSDRWDFFGRTSDIKPSPAGIPYFSGSGDKYNPTANATCNSQAQALDSGAIGGPTSASLSQFGCYANGNSVLIPPALGTFGTMGRNIFRDNGFWNWDFSVSKNWKFRDRITTQFRAEGFNIVNHPNLANPWGGPNGYAHTDPSAPGSFGCSCATADVAGANPVIGSGGNRAVQLGLKILF